jgi:Lecithin retinol acyltransferase
MRVNCASPSSVDRTPRKGGEATSVVRRREPLLARVTIAISPSQRGTGTLVTFPARAQHTSATRCSEARINRRRSEAPRVDRGTADSSMLRGARRLWVSWLAADRREKNRRPNGLSGIWLSVDELDPPLGAHLGTPRCGYLHHGIYVGGGHVVHYAGYVHGFRRGPVEEVELARFRGGRSLWVAPNAKSIFDRREVVCRARSRIGESRYRLFANNCEHFCEWCLNGEQRSYQVEALLAWRRRALAAPLKVAVRLLSGLQRANLKLVAWVASHIGAAPCDTCKFANFSSERERGS